MIDFFEQYPNLDHMELMASQSRIKHRQEAQYHRVTLVSKIAGEFKRRANTKDPQVIMQPQFAPPTPSISQLLSEITMEGLELLQNLIKKKKNKKNKFQNSKLMNSLLVQGTDIALWDSRTLEIPAL
jgi:hypothetical protein